MSKAETINVKGTVSHGVVRGKELVERFIDRLTGVIGWRPYPGTFNVRFEKPLDIHHFETQRLEHILLDGSTWVDLRLAPAKLHYKDNIIEVWWLREERGIHEEDVIEIISPDHLMEKYQINYGDEVELELYKHSLSLRERLHLFWRGFAPKGRVVK